MERQPPDDSDHGMEAQRAKPRIIGRGALRVASSGSQLEDARPVSRSRSRRGEISQEAEQYLWRIHIWIELSPIADGATRHGGLATIARAPVVGREPGSVMLGDRLFLSFFGEQDRSKSIVVAQLKSREIIQQLVTFGAHPTQFSIDLRQPRADDLGGSESSPLMLVSPTDS